MAIFRRVAPLFALALAAGLPARAANLLRNPGFEQGDVGWSVAGHTWYEAPKGSGLSAFGVDTTVAHTGRHSLRLNGRDNRGVGLQRVDCQPGLDYRASAWVRTQGLGPVEAGFDVGLLAADNRWIDGVAPKALTGDHDWTLLSVDFTPPPGTRYLQLHLFTRAANRGVVWFDDIDLAPLLPPPPVSGLKLSPSGADGVALDWSAWPKAAEVTAFRVYRARQPFAEIGAAERVAELKPEATRTEVPAARDAFLAVTAVGAKGREDAQVVSLSLRSQPAAPPTPPQRRWSDDWSRGQRQQVLNRVQTGPGGARLARRRSREWFTVADRRFVRSAGGWTAARCEQAGAALTIRFTGRYLGGYAPGNPDLGVLEIALDGGRPRELDLACAWTPNRRLDLAECPQGGAHTVTVRCTGRKHAAAKSAAVQIDVFEVTDEGYAPDGLIVSAPLVCPPGVDYRWGRLSYAAGTPPGTSVAVDVLDGAGQVLLAGAADGADLGALRAPVLALRARLYSATGQASPMLAFWQVSYEHPTATASVAVDAVTGQPVTSASRSGTGDETVVTAPGYLDGQLGRPGEPVLLCPAAQLLGQRLHVWPVSMMDSLFQDTEPPRERGELTLALEAAGNEVEAAQLALRPTEDLGRVRVSVSELRGPGGVIPAANLRTYFVGYVPVPVGSPDMPPAERARPAPGWFPDPLLTDDDCELTAGRTQPVWVSVKVPRDARPGAYAGAVRLHTALGTLNVPLRLTVYPFALPDESHLWFGHGGSGWAYLLKHYGTTGSEEERWRIIKMALRDRAEHRENVVCIDDSAFALVRTTRTAAGEYRYDYTELDRWLTAIRETYPHGRYLVESMCFAGRDGWDTKEIFFHGCPVYDERGQVDAAHSIPRVSTDADQFKAFARPFLAALEQHLAQVGLLDRFYTRLQDEPIDASRDAYLRLTQFVRDCAPRLKRFESIQTLGLAGHLEIMNPQLDWFDRHRAYFAAARKPGQMVWFYTCWMPRGQYPSRLIDYPLLKHRIINQMSYALGADGYDRWAWAWWDGDPYDPPAQLAPGDNYVVYPDPRRREIIGSLRWEMMRESMEDYEYLWLLGQRQREAAQALGAREGEFDAEQWPRELAARAVTSGTVYERDPARLLALRREVAAAIAAAGATPRCVWQVAPLGDGLRVTGLTAPGTQIAVNGKPTPVAADGRFVATVPPGRVTVQVRADGASREMVRTVAAGGR